MIRAHDALRVFPLRAAGAAGPAGSPSHCNRLTAGIPSTSISALLIQLEHRPLQAGTVLVVDEAGMAGTPALAALAQAVDAADGKLVLVGDDRQLEAIDAGDEFRALARRGPSIQLTQNPPSSAVGGHAEGR